jgi:protease IV
MMTVTKNVLRPVLAAAICAFLLSGCTFFRIGVGFQAEEPLREATIKGKGRDKILLVPIQGFLSDSPQKGILGERPSVVQEVIARLQKAEKDDAIKAVVLEVNSPGGSVTASDILYHEISAFKGRTNKMVAAVFLDVAASGAYYLALAADRITAHPTGITGSVGVVMMTPKVPVLMEKLGVAMEVTKSGREKDIGSPFRASTAEDTAILQDLIDRLARRFLSLVVERRKIDPGTLSDIASARIYPAEEALRLGLIDSIGYLDDALAEARRLLSLPEDNRIVVYRRTKQKDDTVYNTALSQGHQGSPSLFDTSPLGPFAAGLRLPAGPYYLWLPGILSE